MNPLLSVLLPSRGRFLSLLKTVKSFDYPGVEIIVRMDKDDLDYVLRLPELLAFKNIKVIIGDRGRGYLELGTMYNDCASISNGDWIMGFNDDAWAVDDPTKELRGLDATKRTIFWPVVDWPIDHESKEYKWFKQTPRLDFPCVSRAAYLAVGKYAVCQINDWVWLDCFRAVPSMGGHIGHFTVMHTYQRVKGFLPSNVDEPQVVEYKLPETQKLIREAIQRLKA